MRIRQHQLDPAKVYKSQVPIVEQALEDVDPRILLSSTLRLFQFLPGEQKQELLRRAAEAA